MVVAREFARQWKILGKVRVNLPSGSGPVANRNPSLAVAELLQEVRRPKITAARGIGFNRKSATPRRKLAAQVDGHRHVRRLLGILACHFHLPATPSGAKEQRRGKLRAFLDADAAFAGAWSGAMDER